MRRIFEKSICKCPRCVAKRRIRFLTVLVACIAVSAAYVVLIDHREPTADPFLSMKATLAKEPNLDPGTISNRDSETVSTALAEPGIPAEQQDMGTAQERMAQDDFSANPSPKPTKYPASLYGSVNLPVRFSSNPIGEPPGPHTKGWQTAVMGDAPESARRGEAQGALQLDGAKVAAAVKPEPSPEPTNSEPIVGSPAETSQHKGIEDLVMVYGSDPYQLLPPWLKESGSTVQGKSEESSSIENKLAVRSQELARGDPEPVVSQTSPVLIAGLRSEIPKSETPEADTDRALVIAQIETSDSTPKSAFEEKLTAGGLGGVDVSVKAVASTTPANTEPAATEAAEPEKNKGPEDVAVVKTLELDNPLPPQPKEPDSAPRWKSGQAVLTGNVVVQPPREPKGYVTIDSESERPQNPPKPQGRVLKAQNHPRHVQDYPSNAQPREAERKSLERKREEAEHKRARLEEMYQKHLMSSEAYKKGEEEYKSEIEKYRSAVNAG